MSSTHKSIVILIMYLLFLLIGLAAIGTVLGFFPTADESFRKWAVAALFVDIAAAVGAAFSIAIKSRENRVFVNLEFQGLTPTDVELISCRYEVRDGNNVLKKKGEAAVHRGPGGWQCSFTIVSGEIDYGYARLEMTDGTNVLWRVPNFPLNNVTMQAERVA